MSEFFLKVPTDFATTIGRFDLSAREIQVLFQLFSHKNRKTGLCYPSQRCIAAELHLDPRYVRACIASLKRKGFLKTTCKRMGDSNHYSIYLSPEGTPMPDDKPTRQEAEPPTLHPSFAGHEDSVYADYPPRDGEEYMPYLERIALDLEVAGADPERLQFADPAPPPPRADEEVVDDGGFGAALIKEILAAPEPPELGTAEYELFYKKMATPKAREEVMQVWVDYERKQGRDPLAAIASESDPGESGHGISESEVRVEANRGQGPGPAENHPADHEDHI